MGTLARSPEIRHHHQQNLEAYLGFERAMRACTPTALYMRLEQLGVMGDLCISKFVEKMESVAGKDPKSNWSRATLSTAIRDLFPVHVISWWSGEANHDVELMRKSGYIHTDLEVGMFNELSCLDIFTLFSKYPVVCTVRPNFGNSGSTSLHSVLTTGFDPAAKIIQVLDPDARNLHQLYSASYFLDNLAPDGCFTVLESKQE